MQSKVRKHLKKFFDRQLPERLPGYAPLRTSEFPQGGFAYMKRGLASNYFITVAAWSKREDFTIEVAWSRETTRPVGLSPFWPNDKPKHLLFEPPGGVRIGQLMGTDDHWWMLAEEMPWDEDISDEEFLESLKPAVVPLEAIEAAVEGALSALVRFWEPLCEKFESRSIRK